MFFQKHEIREIRNSICLIVFGFLISFNASDVFGQVHPIKFKNISTNEGLAQSNVTSIIQDRNGFMWFATRGGLNKFDGYRFTTFTNKLNDPFSISSNSIRNIIEDREGNIWAATLDEGINLFNPSTKKFTRFKNIPGNKNSLSSNSVDRIYEDRAGNIWIGTLLGGLNKYDPKSKQFEIYKHDQNNIESLAEDAILDIFEDSRGNFFIGTQSQGLDLMDRKTGEFKHFKHDPNDPSSIGSNRIRQIFEDKWGNIWIGTEGAGLNLLDLETGKFKRYVHQSDKNSICHNIVMCIAEDAKGQLWIGTENGGLSIFDPVSEVFTNYTHEESDPNSINNNSVYSVCKDKKGNMWVGTYSGGVSLCDLYQKKFRTYRNKPGDPNSLNNNSILTFAEDERGNIWIGTDGGGINYFDREKNKFTHYTKGNRNSVAGNYVVSILFDKDNNLWASTWMDGISYFDRKKNKFINYKNESDNSNSLSHDGTWMTYQDKEGQLWIGTIGGGLERFDKKTQKFTHYRNNPADSTSLTRDYIHYILEDRKGNFWVGTDVAGLEKLDRKTGKFTHYKYNPNKPKSLSNNIIDCIVEDSKGNLWIGTNAGLNKFNYNNNNFEVFLEKETIKGILEDDHGNLWLSSNNGLHRFNPENKSLQSYFTSDGLQSNEFNYKAFLKLKTGEMLFGGPNGFNIFHPDSIKINPIKPEVYITGFNIFNKPATIGSENSPLEKDILYTKEIKLNHNQSVFSFEFTALNYTESDKNQYAYKLAGFDEDWNYVQNIRTATYTNLDPGEYTFFVKASNNDGIWNETPARIKLIIAPPYWETIWFKLAIISAIIILAILIFKLRLRRIEEQNSFLEQQVLLRTSQLEKANNELIYQQKEILSQKEVLEFQTEMMRIKNEELYDKQKEIYIHTERVDALYSELKDSIRAAEVIQQAVLPPDEMIKTHLPEFFVLNKPKDVISGDFYWFNVKEGKLMIAVADCTGHGVSGAFMSINGYHLLKHAISKKTGLSASEILDRLNDGVVTEFYSKQNNEFRHGMDISLCIIDDNRRKLQYSGAGSCLYIIRGDELMQMKGDKYSIGMLEPGKAVKYQNIEVDLQSGDLLYLFTDGYADQIGGEDGQEKLMLYRFREFLLLIKDQPMEMQKNLLDSYLEEWKNGNEQLDDILIVGFKIF